MDHFFAILARSVAAEGRDSTAARVAIYDRARVQLEHLIAESDPPLPAETEYAYRQDLEAAISRIESEYASRGPKEGPTAEAVAAFIGAQHAATTDDARATPDPTGAPPITPPSGPRGAIGWDDEKPGRFAALRLPAPVVFAAAVIGAIGFGIWLILSSIFAPSLPSMDAVAQRLDDTGAAVLFVGAAAERLSAPEDTTVSNVRELFGPGVVRIESRVEGASANRRTQGARIMFSRDIRAAIADSTLRLIVVARAAPDNPSPEFALAISGGARRSSGWQRFELDDTFRPYAIEYAFGEDAASRLALVSILADTQGQGRAIEVSEVSLKVVPN
ncbi:hypothetical protein [Microbaculum marinisediminis]|uniref:hypothetical protein n=1 Tax=Microbaculum marinisediminis TaxID=2931392 RepID=UPI0021C0489D|nr:hypothetical protein [Microbaculum sp. A6E488]